MDWAILRKALEVETKHDYSDLVGHQCQFSEFMIATFIKSPRFLSVEASSLWQEMSLQFSYYFCLNLFQRHQLVEHTLASLDELQSDSTKAEEANFSSLSRDELLVDTSYDYYTEYVEQDLEAIEYNVSLSTSQRIDFINGRRVMVDGWLLSYSEYLKYKDDPEKFESLREVQHKRSVDLLQLRHHLEVEIESDFSNVIVNCIQSNQLKYSNLRTTYKAPLPAISSFGNEIRFNKIMCLSLSHPPKSLQVTVQLEWHEIALKFARYTKLKKSERQEFLEVAKDFFIEAYVDVALLPENRPAWASDFSPYAYFDVPYKFFPVDRSVDDVYLLKLSRYGTSGGDVGSTNALIRSFVKDKEKMPETWNELHSWVANAYFHLEDV